MIRLDAPVDGNFGLSERHLKRAAARCGSQQFIGAVNCRHKLGKTCVCSS
jgi:hypothetical protein